MRRQLGGAVLAASLACGAAHAAKYPAMYSFGDSLSDAGNALIVSTLLGHPVPLPAFYFDGRFSNGPNWVDDLTNRLGLGLSAVPSLAGGNDFAFGGAQTGPTSVNPGLPSDLVDQVAAFGTAVPSPKTGALYTLDIGANDIRNALTAVAKNPLFDLSAFLSAAVANTVGAIDTLYFSDHARNLLYYETPDLSVVPAFKAGGALGGELAMAFNDDVLAGIKPLEGKGGLKVFDVPVFNAIDEIVKDPAMSGLTNATTPCFSGNFDIPGRACANPDQFLFWDGEHPTAAGHLLTADLAFKVLTAPEPATWAMMLIGFAGLGLAGWRAQRSRVANAQA
jgi:phospholipase/lecithinase/hemolysin